MGSPLDAPPTSGTGSSCSEEAGSAGSDELTAHALALIDANLYLTLGTTDPDGRPWTSPVFFAAAGTREFYWVSETDARHSRNLAQRPHVSIVIFDSTVAPYHGRALYAVGQASEVAASELNRGLEIYPGPASRGGSPVTEQDVTAPAPYRLYRATMSDLWVLCPREPRQPCPLHGLARDHRTRIA
jgi:hypothetical protein